MIPYTSNTKRGMIWYSEFVVAIFIFLLSLSIYFEYRNNILLEDTKTLEEMIIDVKKVSNYLLSTGSPANWTNKTFKTIGLTNGNYRLNESKLLNFSVISTEIARGSFGIHEKYHLFLLDNDGNPIDINGQAFIGEEPIDYDRRVRVTRLAIYKSNVTRVIIELWE